MNRPAVKVSSDNWADTYIARGRLALVAGQPRTNSDDAPAQESFVAQFGFRARNMAISPLMRKSYVSHLPMDHSAIIKFVASRFLGSLTYLTDRDAAQPRQASRANSATHR